jgi:RimJ/RimL family protein N-acetyltransferase
MSANSNNLHKIPAFENVTVRDDIILRPLELSDGPRMLEILAADPQIRKRVEVARIVTNMTDLQKEIATFTLSPDYIRYSIIHQGKYAGLVSFWRLGRYKNLDEPDVYGFGYFLDPALRGKGIVPDALHSLMSLACKHLTVKYFMAWCEDDNEASKGVLKKCGFTATDDVHYFADQNWHERVYIKYPIR